MKFNLTDHWRSDLERIEPLEARLSSNELPNIQAIIKLFLICVDVEIGVPFAAHNRCRMLSLADTSTKEMQRDRSRKSTSGPHPVYSRLCVYT
jgi:hypothetical protein